MSQTTTITVPEDALLPGPIVRVDEKTGNPDRVFVRKTFAEHIADLCSDPAQFGADLAARRRGHAIRDAFAKAKAGESVTLPAEHAAALHRAADKPTGGYQASMGAVPTSWLFAIPEPAPAPAPAPPPEEPTR